MEQSPVDSAVRPGSPQLLALQTDTRRSRSISPVPPYLQSPRSVHDRQIARAVSGSVSGNSPSGSPRRGWPVSRTHSIPASANENTHWMRTRAPNVILELDLNCNVVWGSKSWMSVIGVDVDALVGRSISDILIGDKDVFQKATDAILDTNSSYRVRFTILRHEIPSERLSHASSHSESFSDADRTSTSASSPHICVSQDEAFPAVEAPLTSFTNSTSSSTSSPLVRHLPTPSPALSVVTTNTSAHGVFVGTSPPSSATHQSLATASTFPITPSSSGSRPLEMEGQGIMIFDRNTAEPIYSMWVLKPYVELVRPVIDLPQTLVDSLGFGADVLATYLAKLSLQRVTDLRDCPAQDPIMCRICERQIQPWWFERHSELCLVEHKAENEVQNCQDMLTEQRSILLELLKKLDDHDTSDVSVDYRGSPLISPSSSPQKSVPSTKFSLSQFKHLTRPGHRSPFRTVEMLMDLCDLALEIKTPALRDSDPALLGDGGFQIRVNSPDSESRLKKVMSFQSPSSFDSDGMAALCHDTEKIAKNKINAILRLSNTITYAEKIQRELSAVVQEAIEETVADVIAQQNALDGPQDGDLDDDTGPLSDSEELGFFSSYTQGDYQDECDSPSLAGSHSVASGSSPTENNTPKSFGPLLRHKSRKNTLIDEEGGDSDSSRSSFVYLREKSDGSPVSDPDLTRQMLRKSSASFLFGSPHRQKSPSLSFSKSPLSTQKLKTGSAMQESGHNDSIGNGSSFTPLTSPLLFPIDSYDHSRNQRRQSSTTSDFTKIPLSPLLSSVTPAIRPAQPSIRDFEVIKPISRGAFGSVFLTKKKNTGEYFAIKVLKKADMVAKNQVTNVKAERAIMMAQAESSFVAKLFFTFKSKDYLYLVMEYLNGGDCASLLKNLGTLPEEWVQKYIAEIVLGIENLHEQGIVHRDLKPDNFLIDKDGHLKLTDFGLSRMGLIGRQAGHANFVNSPDIFPGPSNNRQFSFSSQSGAGDTPLYVESNPALGVSPNSTPWMLPDSSVGLSAVPGYFSLNKSALTEGLTKSLSQSSVAAKSESIQSMLGTFSLHHDGHLSHYKEREDDTQSTDSMDSSDANLHHDASQHSSAPSVVHRPSMPPPPLPSQMQPHNLVLFDPAKDANKFVGTPDYLAPETIMGTGQDEMCDWWSLGCVVFEFLYGYPPFHAATPNEVFQNILARKINWPDQEENSVSLNAVDLINRLICTDPAKRLGSGGSAEVKEHPFFVDVNWETVAIAPGPFVPSTIDDEDTMYFDDRGASLQTFPEEEGDGLEAKLRKNSGEETNSSDESRGKLSHHSSLGNDSGSDSSGGRDSSGSVNSTSSLHTSFRSGKLPLHIPQHFRGRRARRLSEPAAVDDFGTFSFKNLNVLEKANKDVIQRLKSEHLEQMKAPIPIQPSGLIEPSPIKPRNSSVSSLGSSIAITGHVKRPSSPSSSGSSASSSSLFRNASPGRGMIHTSIPSSPLTTSVYNALPDIDNDATDDDSEPTKLKPPLLPQLGTTRTWTGISDRSQTPPSPLSSRKVSSSSLK
ncbi:uncharacterized protein V1518DRAFT_452928 [Limtongia smithiae]|uniref:uncharacterized protein n=1 Tax=Limtongia smithiae TaxID=1125753 RepID=UPI0034CF0F86